MYKSRLRSAVRFHWGFIILHNLPRLENNHQLPYATGLIPLWIFTSMSGIWPYTVVLKQEGEFSSVVRPDTGFWDTNACCKLSFFITTFDVLKGLSSERKRYVLLFAVPTDFKSWNILPHRAQKLLLSALTFLGRSQCGQLEGLTALLTAVTVIIRWSLSTPYSTVILEKLSDSQLVKKFHGFCGTRMFTTAFTLALHLPLSWARSVQPMLPHPTSWRSILILSSNLLFGLPSGLFLLGFRTKILYVPLLASMSATYPAHLIFSRFDHPNCV